MQLGFGLVSSIPEEVHVTSQMKRSLTKIGKIDRTTNSLSWQEQGRHALNSQQAVFETAAQNFEQAIRDELHVAAAKATDMSRAVMRKIMSAVENQAEQTGMSH